MYRLSWNMGPPGTLRACPGQYKDCFGGIWTMSHNKFLCVYLRYRFGITSDYTQLQSWGSSMYRLVRKLLDTRSNKLIERFLNTWFRASWFNVNKRSNSMQQYADIYLLQSLYMFRVSQHPSSGVLKTVSATSGISHGTGTATSFHRGPIRPRWKEVAVPVRDMTYTRGSRYSF